MPFSLNNKHIIVNYHYVEDPNENNAGMHPCSAREFEKHVSFLKKHYRFASLQEVYESAKKKKDEKVCSFTFDDGLKDQYEIAVPILKKYNAQATFFIITSVFEGYVPSTQKAHMLFSKLPIAELIDSFASFLKKEYPHSTVQHVIPKDKRLYPERRLYEDIPTANFKEVFLKVPYKIKEHFLSDTLARLKVEERGIFSSLFMGEDEVIQLQKDGFEVGSHTHRHHALTELDPEETKKDFLKSKTHFLRILGDTPAIFSYPHGYIPDSYKDILKEEKFTHAVTIERRAVVADDSPFLIPRFDPIDIREFLGD